MCAHFAHDAGLWRIHGDFHFHRFQDDEFLASLYLLTDLYPHLPQVAGDIAFHAVAAFGQRRFGGGACRRVVAFEVRLSGVDPALALRVEGRGLV